METTTESNRLIAEFMGDLKIKELSHNVKVLITEKEHSFFNTEGIIRYIDNDSVAVLVNDGSNRWVGIDGFEIIDFNFPNRYHLDWNLLMEVVERINDLNNVVEIHENHVRVVSNTRSEALVDVVSGSMLEAVYNACVEFIKLQNEQ